MKPIVCALLLLVSTVIRSRLSLQLEIVALRHQLTVYQRTTKRPQINSGDRILWSWLSRRWSGWRDALVFVRTGTVIAWQRKRFRDHWAKLSKHGRPGRPTVSEEIKALIRKISEANKRVKSMGIEEMLTAPRSPWQNAFVERVIGSIRQDCLDHVVVLNKRHLKRILTSYFDYYHHWRTHLSLGMDSPESRSVQPPALGKVVQFPEVGGLRHYYERLAA